MALAMGCRHTALKQRLRQLQAPHFSAGVYDFGTVCTCWRCGKTKLPGFYKKKDEGTWKW